jgi:hypothetical protein
MRYVTLGLTVMLALAAQLAAQQQPADRVLRCDPGPRRVPPPDGAWRYHE